MTSNFKIPRADGRHNGSMHKEKPWKLKRKCPSCKKGMLELGGTFGAASTKCYECSTGRPRTIALRAVDEIKSQEWKTEY